MVEIENLTKVLLNIEIAKGIKNIKNISEKRDVIFLCVGNSKIWYDSFGPIVGTLCQYIGVKNYIYGNLRANINQSNLEDYINIIYRFHYNPFVVVFDSALSISEDFFIKIIDGPTECAGLSDNSVLVGDLSVQCIVPQKDIKNCDKYINMLSEIKKLGLYFKEFYL